MGSSLARASLPMVVDGVDLSRPNDPIQALNQFGPRATRWLWSDIDWSRPRRGHSTCAVREGVPATQIKRKIYCKRFVAIVE